MKKIFPLFISIGICSIALYFSNSFTIPFEIPKVFLFNRFVEVMLILIAFLFFKEKHNKIDKGIAVSLLLFLIAVALSMLFGKDVYKSFWGNYYRRDGLFTLVHLVAFSMIIASYWRDKYINTIASWVALTNVFISFAAIVHFVSLPNSNWVPFFGNPDLLAGYLLVTLPLNIVFFRKIKMVGVIGILLSIIAIYFSHSVASVVGVLAFFVGMLWYYKKIKAFGLASGVIFLIFVSLYLFLNLQRDTSANRIAESRKRIYAKAILATVERPVLGWGWANFDYAFTEIDWPIHYEHDAYVDKAHGHLLEISSTAGLVTLTIYLLLSLTAGRILHKKNKLLFISFLLFIFQSQTNVISIAQELFFWLYVGIAATISPKKTGNGKTTLLK